MKDVLDDLDRIITKLQVASTVFEVDPLRVVLIGIDNATHAVGKASSNSWHGYQSSLYLRDFKIPSHGEHFNSDWGIERAFGSTTRGDWVEYSYEVVESEILRRARVADLDALKKAAADSEAVFLETKAYLAPLLDVVIDLYNSNAISQLKEKVVNLEESIDPAIWINHQRPRLLATRDRRAQSEMTKGPKPPHHIAFQAMRMHFQSYGHQAGELCKMARHTKQYLEARRKILG